MTTASGLQIIDNTVGTGASPKTGQTCVMHYTGWLYENGQKGKKFDSSVDRNEPSISDRPGPRHQGLDEGVASMKVGGKRTLIIPPALGYGARGAGGVDSAQRHADVRCRIAGGEVAAALGSPLGGPHSIHVMPGPVPGIHVFTACENASRGWPGTGERSDAVLQTAMPGHDENGLDKKTGPTGPVSSILISLRRSEILVC